MKRLEWSSISDGLPSPWDKPQVVHLRARPLSVRRFPSRGRCEDAVGGGLSRERFQRGEVEAGAPGAPEDRCEACFATAVWRGTFRGRGVEPVAARREADGCLGVPAVVTRHLGGDFCVVVFSVGRYVVYLIAHVLGRGATVRCIGGDQVLLGAGLRAWARRRGRCGRSGGMALPWLWGADVQDRRRLADGGAGELRIGIEGEGGVSARVGVGEGLSYFGDGFRGFADVVEDGPAGFSSCSFCAGVEDGAIGKPSWEWSAVGS